MTVLSQFIAVICLLSAACTTSTAAPEAEPTPTRITGRVVQVIHDHMPGPGPTREPTATPMAVPVHVFRGQVRVTQMPDPQHAQLVAIVQANEDGSFALTLSEPGTYTVVAEIDGKLRNIHTDRAGFYHTVTVEDGQTATVVVTAAYHHVY